MCAHFRANFAPGNQRRAPFTCFEEYPEIRDGRKAPSSCLPNDITP